MNATELVHRARAAGLELEPRGDKLRVRGPEPLPRHILTALRTQKAEVLAKLVAPGHRYRPLLVDRRRWRHRASLMPCTLWGGDPWSEWKRGKPLSPRGLSDLLKPFKVKRLKMCVWVAAS